MTTITPTDFRVVRDDGQSLTVKGGESISSRKGKYCRQDATTGLAMVGNASSAAEAGPIGGFAMTDQSFNGDSFTLFRRGLIDWGSGLDAINDGVTIYLGDTDSVFQTTAGSQTIALGKVVTLVESDGSAKKFLLADIQ